MRFLLLFFFGCLSCSLFADTFYSFQLMLSRYDSSVILAVGGVEIRENGTSTWGWSAWGDVGWYWGGVSIMD